MGCYDNSKGMWISMTIINASNYGLIMCMVKMFGMD